MNEITLVINAMQHAKDIAVVESQRRGIGNAYVYQCRGAYHVCETPRQDMGTSVFRVHCETNVSCDVISIRW
jgi:hypothetical protein